MHTLIDLTMVNIEMVMNNYYAQHDRSIESFFTLVGVAYNITNQVAFRSLVKGGGGGGTKTDCL